MRSIPRGAASGPGSEGMAVGQVIEAILPPEAHAASARQDDDSAVLFPEEAAVIARAVDRRRREFATGRACARAALASLGIPACPILPGTRGAPQWPAGIVGSITHCDGYRAAAVARSADLLTVGIDAEPNAELPDGVLRTIASEREAHWIRALSGELPNAHWDRLLFSAKESVYKAWYPVTGSWLGFDEAEIALGPVGDADSGSFTTTLLTPARIPVRRGTLTEFPGRWLVRGGLVMTAVTIPARA